MTSGKGMTIAQALSCISRIYQLVLIVSSLSAAQIQHGFHDFIHVQACEALLIDLSLMAHQAHQSKLIKPRKSGAPATRATGGGRAVENFLWMSLAQALHKISQLRQAESRVSL